MNLKSGVDKGIDIKEKILRAAAEEFSDKGFGGARVDEIANRAGVNKATLYYQIGDKAALYAEVLTMVMASLADEMYKNLKRDVPPDEKLKSHIMTEAKTFGSNITFTRIMLREIASGGASLPDEALMQMKRIISCTVSILEEGKKAKVFGHVNPFIVHMMVIGTLLLYTAGEPIRKRISALNSEASMLPVEQAAEDLADILLKALRVSDQTQNKENQDV
ncbi:MAG: TetR/AcrR family transcriptional regulator [Nitrospinota bacterium]